MTFEPRRHRWPGALDQLAPGAILDAPEPLLRRAESFVAIGGPLAERVAAEIALAGYPALPAEPAHPLFDDRPASFGRIATALGFLQLLQRCRRTFVPAVDRWTRDGLVIDAFRPAMAHQALNDVEFELLRDQFLDGVRAALRRAATVLVVLQTTEFFAAPDGAAYPLVPGEEPGFEGAWRRDGVGEVAADLIAAADELRAINPAARLVVAVSPEPIGATAAGEPVVVANGLAKATLRLAAAEAAKVPGVFYFPALEAAALLGGGVDEDWRKLSDVAVQRIADLFIAACEDAAPVRRSEDLVGLEIIEGEKSPATPSAPSPADDRAARKKRRQERKNRDSG